MYYLNPVTGEKHFYQFPEEVPEGYLPVFTTVSEAQKWLWIPLVFGVLILYLFFTERFK